MPSIESDLMGADTSKRAGIKEIAAALGISIGTVDRALHARAGVSPKTMARVLKAAESLDYKPNLAARNLKLNRKLRIAVHLPEQIATFFDPLRDGIRAAVEAAHALNAELDFHSFPRLGTGEEDALSRNLGRHYDGIIMTPGNPEMVDHLIRSFTQEGAAVVCVASDAPRTQRVASVCVDAMASGGIAAELLGTAIQAKGTVAIITGNLKTLDHAEKLRGFAATLAISASHLTLLPAVETHEDEEEAYQATKTLLRDAPDLKGIYVCTANSLPVLKALRTEKRDSPIRVVATDLFQELVPSLIANEVFATLHQRPFTQGRLAFQALSRYLLDGELPSPVHQVSPHIVLRSNLNLLLYTNE